MRVRLNNNAIFWALAHPQLNQYIGHGTTAGLGYSQVDIQQTQITLTEDEPISDEFDYDSLPSWAKHQIETSKASGLIEVLGSPVIAKRVERSETETKVTGKIDEEDEKASLLSLLDKSVAQIKKLTKDLPPDTIKNLLEAEKANKNRIGVVSFLEEQISS